MSGDAARAVPGPADPDGLARRLAAFFGDLDWYGFTDGLEAGETEEDAAAGVRAMLESPVLVRSAAAVLEEILEDGTLEEDEIPERERCRELIRELRELYGRRTRDGKTERRERSDER